jgi:ankyrin repeat protein
MHDVGYGCRLSCVVLEQVYKAYRAESPILLYEDFVRTMPQPSPTDVDSATTLLRAFAVTKNSAALALAARIGDPNAVEDALGAGITVDAIDPDSGNVGLFEAAWNGHTDVVKFLVDAGADVTRSTDTGKTALFQAATYGHTGVVQVLLAAHAPVNVVTTVDGLSPLFGAAQNGYADIVRLLLMAGADVENAHRVDGRTALFMSAKNGHTAVVRLLLGAGAAVDTPTGKEGWTPLVVAVVRGHAEVVAALVGSAASVEHAAANGWTALDFAAKEEGFSHILGILKGTNAT